MSRFHLQRRVGEIKFDDFIRFVTKLATAVKELRPTSTVKILTCEDRITYQFSTVTILTDEIQAAIKRRREYSLESFTREIWDRSFKVEMLIHDPTDKMPFMICVSRERVEEKDKLFFYAQCLDDSTKVAFDSFKRPRLLWKVGDGFPKCTDFNSLYAQFHTKPSLTR